MGTDLVPSTKTWNVDWMLVFTVLAILIFQSVLEPVCLELHGNDLFDEGDLRDGSYTMYLSDHHFQILLILP